MLRVYTLLLWLALPFASLLVLWRGIGRRDYWRGWGQRFGRGVGSDAPHVWVHAVSVGEVQAACIVVRALLALRPHTRILLTSATPTGRERARQQLAGTVDIRYAPYDIGFAIRRVLRGARVSMLVVLEAEIWPNLWHECACAGVPVCMVSARVSARSVRRFNAFQGLLSARALANLRVAAQTAADAERFAQLGIAPSAISVCGNLKFDQHEDGAQRQRGAALRAHYAATRPLWVAGSTRDTEEAAVLDAHDALCASRGDCLLVLAPRHPQRFEVVAGLLRERKTAFIRRSECLSASDSDASRAAARVLLLDRLGELTDFYAASDLAFVGGSLVPVGGHNLLEPAVLGVATIAGPQQFNAPDIARLLRERGALCVVENAAELSAAVVRLMNNVAARRQLGDAARTAVADSRGALQKILQLIGSAD
jgi:3-deoxy-D-manno-octulosonic-acid transferase